MVVRRTVTSSHPLTGTGVDVPGQPSANAANSRLTFLNYHLRPDSGCFQRPFMSASAGAVGVVAVGHRRLQVLILAFDDLVGRVRLQR